MKIKTYIARDMKAALREVRAEQGPDAVLLSTRHFAGGVEVTVAVEPAEATPPEGVAAAPVDDFAAVLAHTAAAEPAAAADPLLGSELRSMRQLLESQVSKLAWDDLARRAPATVQLLKELTAMGLAGPLAAELLRELPADLAVEDAQRRTLAALARRIRTTGDELLDRGGRVAFVGPTGVGKTTGIAKLAARWVMRHGPRDIALVSLDDARFGAHEQLRVLGRLLGTECYTLDEPAALGALLARLPRHRLILIDTAGISPRDRQLQQRATAFGDLARHCGVEPWLTLSAGAQAGVIGDAMQAFHAFAPRALLLTKVDEAASLGGILSALASSALPVAYMAGGPRIPEDLAPARAHQLVARAVFLARSSDTSVGEELLVSRFGGVAHDLR
ncbi:MAG TPA: flagellar biosynthesis protein FlhF [Steroidobacteraceae bacterium]|nr:flagellar biosynthesis protein FlhF [Steroidobacteraceae bacterium]